MITIQNEKDCCGCSACAAICPTKCIKMEIGSVGALYPKVDIDSCVGCNKCDAVCPMKSVRPTNKITKRQRAYAAYSTNEETRYGGSSGGVFGTIAKCLIDDDYVIYGAGFDERLKLRCLRAENEKEIEQLLKSKYVQSQMDAAYENIRSDLEQGRKVLLVAAPCQVSATLGYLRKKYENLITVDFLCHGVPSQQMFDRCMHYEEEKYGYKILNYSFRSKIKGGTTPHYFTMKIEKNGKQRTITRPYYKSVYYALYQQQYITVRDSCYDCIFSGRERASDLTIADFHAIESYEPTINRFDGVSTVISNTEKGEKLFETIKEFLWYKEYPIEDLICNGVLFLEKTKRPSNRDDFAKDFASMDFKKVVRRYISWTKYCVYDIYYRMPKMIRKFMRGVLNVK